MLTAMPMEVNSFFRTEPRTPEKTFPVEKKALVIGGGVGGMQASLDLANDGYEVYLVEKQATIGGKMAMLDRTFPTDDCSI